MTGHAYRAGASARVLRFDCGRVCLDLAATAHPVERLDGPDRLRQWLAGAGLVPPGTPLERAGPGWLAAFRDLRTQIAAVVGAELDGRPPGHALDRVNAVARNPPPPPRAVRRADGTLGRGLSGDPDCQALLGAVARDAVELLTDPGARALLRRCAGQDCPLVYLDTSRGRRRRWCSGETCGNRERVARHRRSRRG